MAKNNRIQGKTEQTYVALLCRVAISSPAGPVGAS